MKRGAATIGAPPFFVIPYEFSRLVVINLINEGELAKEFGAGWNSKYIWVFYKWILIEKVNSGIS